MCGIVGFVGREHRAMDVLIHGLRRLEYRGYDSAGVAILNQEAGAATGRVHPSLQNRDRERSRFVVPLGNSRIWRRSCATRH